MRALTALAQLVLQALLPLLTRRVVAAERQAASQERLEDVLRTYLCYSDPTFKQLLDGILPTAEALAAPPDVYAEHGPARDLKTARLEQLGALWYEQYGEVLSDERLVEEYERQYAAAEERLSADGRPEQTNG